jgi:hypothetical protein
MARRWLNNAIFFRALTRPTPLELYVSLGKLVPGLLSPELPLNHTLLNSSELEAVINKISIDDRSASKKVTESLDEQRHRFVSLVLHNCEDTVGKSNVLVFCGSRIECEREAANIATARELKKPSTKFSSLVEGNPLHENLRLLRRSFRKTIENLDGADQVQQNQIAALANQVYSRDCSYVDTDC